MWFSFPEGSDSITVERQPFPAEITDSKGRSYFRAPDHFAPRILEIPGFSACNPPDGSEGLEELPNQDPLRDGAIGELTARLAAQGIELQNLRSDYNAQQAKMSALVAEKTELERQLAIEKSTVNRLQEAIDDADLTPKVLAKATK